MPHHAVHLVQRIAAPPDKVFDAWATSETFARWFFGGPQSRIVRCDLEPEVGGCFSILGEGPDGPVALDGSFLELSPPNRLAVTLRMPHHFEGVAEVIIDIAEADGDSELTLVQTGVPPEATEESWRRMLARLAAVLEGREAA